MSGAAPPPRPGRIAGAGPGCGLSRGARTASECPAWAALCHLLRVLLPRAGLLGGLFPARGAQGRGAALPGAHSRGAGAPRGLSLRRVQEETASPAERLPSKRFPAFSGWIPLVSLLGRQCGFIRRAGEQGCERVKGWGGHALNCDLWRGQPFCSTQTSRTGAEGHCSINRGMLPKCVITVTRYHTKDEHSGSVTLALNGSLHFHFISPSRTHAALFPFFFFPATDA